MAKVLSVFEFRLKPGVSAEEYERAALTSGGFGRAGERIYLAKGLRGADVGQYLAVVEVESVERSNELWPEDRAPAEVTEGMLRSDEIIARFLEQGDAHIGYEVLKEFQ
jgi:hypothetical protein